ncbi:MAG: membrane protein insertase YidC, partial [Planctomycetaceae bacterium]|nr:membrane protein insertase YidC [Planctomycetaceae bacterium]
MDQQRRFIMFFLLSMGAMYLWLNVGLPFFHPEILEQKAARQVQKQKQVPGEAGSSEVAVVQPADTSDIPPVVAPKEIKLPEFPEQTVELGSLDPESGFYLYVKLNSRGAAVDSIQLNDPRYRELTDRNVPLQLVGESAELSRKTFDLRTEAIDRVLAEKGDSLETVNWKIVEQTPLERVVFEYPAPDGSLVIRKIYELKQGEKSGRDTDTSGYQLQARLEFQNTSAAAVEMTYDLQGPVGFHLENAENTRRYLVIQAGFVSGGSIRHEQVLASEISKQARKKGGVENFQTPLRYLGVDGQYFTALLMPETDQEIQKWVDTAQPILVDRADPEERSEISFILESTEVDIPPQQTVSHQYSLYAGPKRAALLRPLDAESTIEYGWFGWISKIMVAYMNFFHNTMSL